MAHEIHNVTLAAATTLLTRETLERVRLFKQAKARFVLRSFFHKGPHTGTRLLDVHTERVGYIDDAACCLEPFDVERVAHF